MGRPVESLINKVFNRLTVIKQVESRGKTIMWECECICGNIAIVEGNSLKNESTKSCGCLRNTQLVTHGDSNTRLYSIWSNMLSRCYNEKSSYYSYYGGKGVIVCENWHEYLKFKSWAITSGYTDILEIDRIKSDGNYEPQNCRWVDLFVQAYNKKKYESNTSGVTGVNWIERDSKWQARINVNGVRISLGMYKNFNDAVKARLEAEIKYYGELKHE